MRSYHVSLMGLIMFILSLAFMRIKSYALSFFLIGCGFFTLSVFLWLREYRHPRTRL